MCGGSDDDYIKEERADAKAREARIKSGTSQVNKTFDDRFNDGYYNSLKQTYKDTAQPDVNRQAADARASMLFSLARQGLAGHGRGSTIADRNYADLDMQHARQNLSIERNAENIMQQRKNAVNNARTDVLGQLNTSANIGSSMAAARNAIDAQTYAPNYNPTNDLFNTAGKGLLGYMQVQDAQRLGDQRAEAIRNGG